MELQKKNHPQTPTAIQEMESLSRYYTAICHLWRTDVNWKERKRTGAVKKNIDLYSAVVFKISPKPPQNSDSRRSRWPTSCDLTLHPLGRRLSRKAFHPPKGQLPSHKRRWWTKRCQLGTQQHSYQMDWFLKWVNSKKIFPLLYINKKHLLMLLSSKLPTE